MMGCRLTPNSNAPIEELTAKSIKFHQRRVVFGVDRPPPESATRPTLSKTKVDQLNTFNFSELIKEAAEA